jgi:anti-sigma factor RsiW
MKCDGVQERLTSYLDLELSLEERQFIKDHLSICSLCTEELNELKKVGQWVRLIQPEPDPYFENQLLRVIKSSRKEREKRKFWNLAPSIYFRLPVIRRTAMAFVFLFAVLTAYYLGYQSHPFWVAQSVGVSQRDLEKINQEIDFYKDFEMIHQLDVLKKMDQKKEERGGESL